MSRRLRRTKIVTTLGPATDKDGQLEKIIDAGANIARINFSHGTVDEHLSRAKKVRHIANRLGRYVAILGDLQGPKIRISTFKGDKIYLKVGDTFLLDADLAKGEGDQTKVGLDYQSLPKYVVPGDTLLLDDGRVQLVVTEVKGRKVFSQVVIGGPLSNNKGINKLGGGLSADALTEKDKRDILTAAKINVDYLAVSFPRCGEDLKNARELIHAAGCNAHIVAKVERAEAVESNESMEEIILASDVVMVARGDLGVEIGDPQLVGVQKKLIRLARRLNRSVITATQMMESMVNNPMPTRAEVMDVANAVLDGTDAVMLSAETATGKHPAETVSVMAKVCLGAEKVPSINISRHRLETTFNDVEEAVSMSAMYAANHTKGVKAIVTFTESGRSALLASRISSGLPIFAISCNPRTLNLTSMYRGVTPFFYKIENNSKDEELCISLLKEKGYLMSGDLVILAYCDLNDFSHSTRFCYVL